MSGGTLRAVRCGTRFQRPPWSRSPGSSWPPSSPPRCSRAGELLPYTPMTVERVEVLGGIELWVARESLVRLDILNGLILATGSLVAFFDGGAHRVARTARLQLLPPARPRARVFLALDEMLAAARDDRLQPRLPRRRAGHQLAGGRGVRPLRRAGGGLLLRVSRPHRGLAPGARGWWSLGVALFGAAAVLDVLDAIVDEQWVEPPGSAALVAGFALVAVRHLASLPPDAGDTGRDRSSTARA